MMRREQVVVAAANLRVDCLERGESELQLLFFSLSPSLNT